MSNNEIREKIQNAISRSSYFDEVYESELETVIEELVDNLDFGEYKDDIRDAIQDYLDIDDMVSEEVREATKEKLEYC